MSLLLYPSQSLLDLTQLLHVGLPSSHLMRRLRQARKRESQQVDLERKVDVGTALGNVLRHPVLVLFLVFFGGGAGGWFSLLPDDG